MYCASLALALCVALGSIPPLTNSQRDQLTQANDSDPGLDAAFNALRDNAQTSTDRETDEPIRLHPDFDAILKSPQDFRGDLCRIEGRIEQVTPLPAPHNSVYETFVRTAHGKPVIVYIAQVDSGQALTEGRQVQLNARFYKRMSYTARDGVLRSYPAFVAPGSEILATNPVKLPADEPASQTAWLIAPVLVMGVVFALLLIFARSRRFAAARAGSTAHGFQSPRSLDESTALPDDPADALAELKRRADALLPHRPNDHAQN